MLIKNLIMMMMMMQCHMINLFIYQLQTANVHYDNICYFKRVCVVYKPWEEESFLLQIIVEAFLDII